MEAIAQLLVAIATFIFEATFHVLVFIFLLVMAIFSPLYREKLRLEWKTSTWKRFSLVLVAAMYSSALILALPFWMSILPKRSYETVDKEQKDSKV